MDSLFAVIELCVFCLLRVCYLQSGLMPVVFADAHCHGGASPMLGSSAALRIMSATAANGTSVTPRMFPRLRRRMSFSCPAFSAP